MAIFEWRKFNFFDLRPNADIEKVAEEIKEAEITCGTSGRGQIVLCDTVGLIHIFTRNWVCNSFKGHDSSIFLCALSQHNNLLITIANDESGPAFKVWNLSKLTKTYGAPCIRTVKTSILKPTALGVSENGQYMAIGFDRGSINLYRGDIGRDRSKTLKTLSSGTSAITGIQFKQSSKNTYMFVCSDSGVLVYSIQSKDREIKSLLDKKYEPARCCALQNSQSTADTHFMVGKDDAIYCYTVDGRGPCYALDGQKFLIHWFRSHLLSITKSTKSILSQQKEYTLTVIDIQNKFIVYTAPIDAVAAIIVEFGTCYIITKNKQVLHLDEKDLESKLNLLFKKNLYDIAIRIAKSQQYDSEGLAGIFKQYGDHLYNKGNFSGAVDQYVKTIGYLEPSYIIRRFLDSRHINYLTDYLQALHKQGKATADHTTLLLNCFTRLDLTDKLKEFLSNDGNPDVIYDLDTAIQVCRSASIEQALALAKRNGKHEQTISILLEDMENYEEALDYISTLPVYESETIIKKYGTLLMGNSPDLTTELLKRLCTLNATKLNSNNESIALLENNFIEFERIEAKNFIQLFSKHSEKLIEFLEHIVLNISNCNQDIYNTLIELYLNKWQTDKSVEDRLMDLLKTYDDVYDKNHILILCRTSNFWPGILWIYEEEKLYHLIVRHHLKNCNYNELLTCCKRLGTSQPSLWLQALTGLRNDLKAPSILLYQILNVIASEKLQSPLQILNCLASEGGPTLSSVREYFLQVFQKETECSKLEETSVVDLNEKLCRLKSHVDDLQKKPMEFRSTICDTCHQGLSIPAVYFLCKHSFHQDCNRSYSENEKDCHVCHSHNLQLMEALREQSASKNQHETFHNILDRSNEPFAVVSEYLKRGLFNKIVIVDEQDNHQEINENFMELTKRHGGIDAASTAFKEYGAGAEAKMRLGEGIVKNPQWNATLIPKSEARLRVEEALQYSSSFEGTTNMVDPTKPGTSPRIAPKISPTHAKQTTKNSLSKNLANEKLGSNPFEGEEDDTYDKSKNPFEDEEDGGKTFNEYDSNLNPFE